jgi:WD40 repeat protein
MQVASGSDDGTLRWWDLASEKSIELKGHTGPIERLALSGDGRFLASAGTDHDVWLWELPSGEGRRLAGHRNTVRGVAFSPDSTRLASTGEDGTAWVWDVTSAAGKQLVKHSHGLRPLVWFDNASLIVGSVDGTIGKFDATTGKGTMKPAHDAEVRCFALSPDRAYLIAGDEDGLVTLWTGDIARRLRTLGRHTDVVRDVVIAGDGKHVISGGGDSILRVFELPDGTTVELAGNKSGVKDIDVSRDGTHVASAGIDGTVRVWPITGGPPRTFHGHGDAVKAIAFAAGDRLISGGEDDRARIWRLADTASPPAGVALRAWLSKHTNVEVRAPRAPR